MLRKFLWWIVVRVTSLLYSARVEGLENVTREGGALLTGNHQSYLDAAMILAWNRREVRFLISHEVARSALIRPFVRISGAIPLVQTVSPRALARALRVAYDYVANGGIVGVFPEGQVTRIGTMQPFRRGYERVTRGLDAPIIPFAVDGAFETIFSLREGRFRWSEVARRPRVPVTIRFGKALPPDASPQQLREAVMELMAEAWKNRKTGELPLPELIFRVLRNSPHEPRFFDASGAAMSGRELLADAMILSRHFQSRGNEISIGGSTGLVHLAAILGAWHARKSVVVGSEAPDVVTDELPVLIEGLRTERFNFPAEAPISHDQELILVNGGKPFTGWNLLAQCRMANQVWRLERSACVLCAYESSRFESILFPLLGVISGAKVVCCQPTAKDVASAVAKHGATHLFLPSSIVRELRALAPPAKLGSLRRVVCTGGLLEEEETDAFEECYGVRPLQALVTATAGLVAISSESVRTRGLFEHGAKVNTYGKVLPGLAAKSCEQGLRVRGEGTPGGEWISLPGYHMDAEGFVLDDHSSLAPASPIGRLGG